MTGIADSIKLPSWLGGSAYATRAAASYIDSMGAGIIWLGRIDFKLILKSGRPLSVPKSVVMLVMESRKLCN